MKKKSSLVCNLNFLRLIFIVFNYGHVQVPIAARSTESGVTGSWESHDMEAQTQFFCLLLNTHLTAKSSLAPISHRFKNINCIKFLKEKFFVSNIKHPTLRGNESVFIACRKTHSVVILLNGNIIFLSYFVIPPSPFYMFTVPICILDLVSCISSE